MAKKNGTTGGMRMFKLTITGLVLVVLAILFWLCCVGHVNLNEVGVVYDSWDGSIDIRQNPGYYITKPWPVVLSVNLTVLPVTVSIPSGAKVVNTKLVRLRAEKVKDFIELQGFSQMLGSQEEDLLRGYAFSGRKYEFLEILQETTPESVESRAKAEAKEGK